MLKIAHIGCGRWGQLIIQKLRQLSDDVELVAVCDVEDDAIKALDLPSSVQSFQDFNDLLATVPCDAVTIATPARCHLDQARSALEADKHVFVEKPLSLFTDNVEELGELAEQRRRTLMVGHLYLYKHSLHRLCGMLHNEYVVGNVQHMHTVRTDRNRYRSDVDIVTDLGPHVVTVQALLTRQSPFRVWASVGNSRTYQREFYTIESCCLHFEYPGNVTSSAYLSWLDPRKQHEVIVTGDEGCVIWRERGSVSEIEIYRGSVERGTLKCEEGIYIQDNDALLDELWEFVRRVYSGESFGADVHQAVVVADILNRIIWSSSTVQRIDVDARPI